MKVTITPNKALQLEQAIGIPASFWLARERQGETSEHDFSGSGDLTLIAMLHQEMEPRGDVGFAEAILEELGQRYLKSLDRSQDESDKV